jgi:excisionase family DNA binding protein
MNVGQKVSGFEPISILLKPSDVARRLNISRSLAYRLLQSGEIPVVRFGHSLRVQSSDLEYFILRNYTGSPAAG